MILLRSPYHIYVTQANLDSALLELYVYSGTQTTDRPVSPAYTLEVTAISDAVTFEISELVRDYLDVVFNGNYISQGVWVDYQITRTVSNVVQTPDAFVELYALDGYGYFENGSNPQCEKYLGSTMTLYVLQNTPVNIPVLQDDLTDAEFFQGGVMVGSQSFTPTDESTAIIRYITTTNNNYIFQDGEDYLFQDGEQFVFSFGATGSGADRVVLTYADMSTQEILIKTVVQCKFNPYRVTFVNKCGALEDLWFYGRNKVTLNTQDSKYKANILTAGTYDTSMHQKRVLNKMGSETIELNSNWYPESMNETFRQLILSDKAWLFYEGEILPINITTSSVQFKDEAGDGLISYQMQAEFAFDKINSVR